MIWALLDIFFGTVAIAYCVGEATVAKTTGKQVMWSIAFAAMILIAIFNVAMDAMK